MSKMNFYTQNGWCGSNYNNKLQTKDIAKKVREFAKKNFPGFKFSVRTECTLHGELSSHARRINVMYEVTYTNELRP